MKQFHTRSFFFTILISILLFTASVLNAQDAAEPRCWGMNFMWGKDFTFSKQPIGSLDYDQSTSDDETVTGFGLDYYLNPRSSLYLLGSIGIGSDEAESTSGKNEFSGTELGLKVGYNYYPYGMQNPVYLSVGPWLSYISYSETQTNTPAAGTKSELEYSASRLGIGVNATAYLKPWDKLNFEFYAGYNLGAYITPESTTTQTFNGESTETKGPSSFHFQDCGGYLGTRFFF